MPIALMSPASFQFLQRLDAARDQILGVPGESLAVALGVEIVDEQGIDRIQAEALQALLIGPHEPVMGVVELDVEVEAAAPRRPVEGLRVLRPMQDPADLGGDQEILARLVDEKAAQAVLGQPAAIPGRGVVEADATVPGGLQRRMRFRLIDPAVHAAEMSGAEPERRQAETGRPHLAAIGR